MKAFIQATIFMTLATAASAKSPTTVDALFTSAKTISGKSVVKNLCNWSDMVAVTDQDVEETKAVIIEALSQSSVVFFKNHSIDLRDIQVGPSDCYSGKLPGMNVTSKNQETGFSVRIEKNRDDSVIIAVHHFYGGKAIATAFQKILEKYKNMQRGAKMLGLGGLFSADNNGALIDDLTAAIETHLTPMPEKLTTLKLEQNGQDNTMYFAASAGKTIADSGFNSLALWDNGSVFFSNRLDIPTQSALPSDLHPADLKKISKETYTSVMQEKSATIKSERVSALYSALAVTLADERCQISSIKVSETGRARGLPMADEKINRITIDKNVGDISVGTILFFGKNGGAVELPFEAGHLDIGSDLVNVGGWLYGKGNVGHQEALYPQLVEKSLCF